VTTAYGGNFSVTNSAAGSITAAAAVNASVTASAGSIGTGYGVCVGSIAGTSNYGIDQSSASNQNYFAGNVGVGTTSPGTKIEVNGALRLDGASSGYLGLQAPATVTTPLTWTLPNGDGSNGQVLVTNGSGTLSWGSSLVPGGTQTAAQGSAAAPGVSFSSDTTTGIYDNGSGTMGFSSGGNSVATLNSTALNLAANEGLTMASGTGQFSQTYTGTTTSANTLTANSVTTASAESITANGLTSGNILSLSSNSTAAAANNTGLNITISGTNGTSSITRYGQQTAVTATGTTSTNVAGYFSASGATNNYGLIVNAGNVGIGTSTPSQLLSIGSSGQLTVDSSGIIAVPSITIGSSVVPYVVSGITNPVSWNGTYNFAGTYNSKNSYAISGNTSYIWWNGSYWLITTARGAFGAASLYNATNSATPPSGAAWGLQGTATVSGLSVTTGVGSNAVIDGGGNISSGANLVLSGTGPSSIAGSVGIGTTSPGYKLDVNGDINIESTFALRFAGTSVCTSAGCTSLSDRTLKEHIQPLQDSLAKVLKLQGVEYDYKDKAKFPDKHQVGVIAQEVEKVYPEVVSTDLKTGLKAVAYDHLIAPLIEAFKALYNRVLGVEIHQASQERQIASKADKSDVETLMADNALKDKEIADLKAGAAKAAQENAEMKARLEKIEKILYSK
jgi:hypothetical protein